MGASKFIKVTANDGTDPRRAIQVQLQEGGRVKTRSKVKRIRKMKESEQSNRPNKPNKPNKIKSSGNQEYCDGGKTKKCGGGKVKVSKFQAGGYMQAIQAGTSMLGDVGKMISSARKEKATNRMQHQKQNLQTSMDALNKATKTAASMRAAVDSTRLNKYDPNNPTNPNRRADTNASINQTTVAPNNTTYSNPYREPAQTYRPAGINGFKSFSQKPRQPQMPQQQTLPYNNNFSNRRLFELGGIIKKILKK
jgi:hypothetical protein